MKKKIAIALVVCLIIVSIMAAPVFAKADKVDLIPLNGEQGSGFVIGNSCAGPLSPEWVPAGPATGNYYKGAGLLRICLKGAEPDATYEVLIGNGNMWFPTGYELKTNAQGNGNFINSKLLGVSPGPKSPYYALSLDDGSGNQVLRFVTDGPVENIVK